LTDPEKLAALRDVDRFRNWRSLDDKRYCLGCEKVITGHQIRIVRHDETRRRIDARCPTDNCVSIPMDWVLPTAEVLRTTSPVTAH
jgi:hypothetical protein